MEKKEIKLRTDVSKAFWCTHDGKFEEAEIPIMKTSRNEPSTISWFDKIFEGGILLPLLPKNKKRAITFLITGSPGSGKSTLAMELCYRWTQNTQIKKEGLRSLYITSEATTEWIRDKAVSFGWEKAGEIFGVISKRLTPKVHVLETIEFKKYLQQEEHLSILLKGVSKAIGKFITIGEKDNEEITEQIATEAAKIKTAQKIKKIIKIDEPDILVIDSLNTIEPTKRPELFERFIDLSSCGPRIILIVLDSGSSQSDFEFWEYICDIVVRLDSKKISDYMVRTIEIIKARYQSHVWGAHQLKIYPLVKELTMDDSEVEQIKKLRQAHPYRKEGGIFIFPSIHYYLSVYKRHAPTTQPTPVETHIDTLNEVLEGGLPKGRCAAFIGCRGGHKSHLGYLHLLSKIVNNEDDKALVISLRDDEGMAEKTMEGILTHEFPNEIRTLKSFRERLEVLYYPPGYITPEEFFHKMFMSIHRLKKGKGELTVLFNSLDQLSARFPLCAKEEIFVTSIIETLAGEGITSIFIAVEEPGQPPEQYGLFTMADLILSFSQRRFSAKDYYGHLKEGGKTDMKSYKDVETRLGSEVQAVVLRVVRFAGGQAAGAGGLLELVNKGKPLYEIYKKVEKEEGLKGKRLKVKEEGLYFTKFSPKHPQEENIELSIER